MPLHPNFPRRRKDLKVVRRQVEDEIFYVVGDPVSHEYLRIGETAGFDPSLLLEEFRRRERAAASSRKLVSGSLALLKLLPLNPDRQLGWMARRLWWCWS